VRNKIFDCLQEIADRAGGTSISINTITQQNAAPGAADASER
jgi:hypothetical protein